MAIIAPNSLAQGLEAFNTFQESLDLEHSDMNEASTRFHVIDNVLRCLGWDDRSFSVERYENGEYSDYELGNPRALIIEAKKEGIHFDLPVNSTKKIIQCLKSVCELSKPIRAAVEQVQSYCSTRGVKNAVVTNGHQYIAFIATRDDGISPFEENCLVFSSLEHLQQNFAEAWQALSPEGIAVRYLQRTLDHKDRQVPRKLSALLPYYPKYRNVSDLQSSLRALSELLIQDIFETEEQEKAFINNCYCESGALSKSSLLSKNILNARYNSLFNQNEKQIKITDVRGNKKTENFDKEVLTEALSKRPIVLLGDVGVGKTSFIKNLRFNSAYEEFHRALFINIDLGTSATLTSNLKYFVLKQVQFQLVNEYNIDIESLDFINGVYDKEIQRFSNTVYGSFKESNPQLYEQKKIEMLVQHIEVKDEHLKKSIYYASKKLKKQIVIIIDNADQRDFDTQQQAFLISQELAKNWEAIVFVSVRPKTFFMSRKAGALSAYPNKVFTIKPPRIENVIKKRLLYAIKMAKGIIPLEDFERVLLRHESMVSFLTSFVYSLDNNNELTELISNITGGNVRQAIELVKGFIGSPNVEAEKIIDETDNNSEPYLVKVHEFSRSILLGDLYHYSEESSTSMNIYDVTTYDPREHFLAPLIISYLNDNNIQDRDGFVLFEKIFSEMNNIGFTSEQIYSAIENLINKKLIETNKRYTFAEIESHVSDSQPEQLRVTSIGAYHVNIWGTTFVYLDSLSHDIPIFDESIFDSLLELIDSVQILDRNSRAKIIRDYLIKCWDDANIKVNYYNFNNSIKINSNTFDIVENVCQKIEREHVLLKE